MLDRLEQLDPLVLLVVAEEDVLVPFGEGDQEVVLLAVDHRRVNIQDQDHDFLVSVLADGVEQLFAAVGIAGVKVKGLKRNIARQEHIHRWVDSEILCVTPPNTRSVNSSLDYSFLIERPKHSRKQFLKAILYFYTTNN